MCSIEKPTVASACALNEICASLDTVFYVRQLRDQWKVTFCRQVSDRNILGGFTKKREKQGKKFDWRIKQYE